MLNGNYLIPSNPSSEPLIVSTGVRAYAFATRRFLSNTMIFAQISSSICVHLSNTSWMCSYCGWERKFQLNHLIIIIRQQVELVNKKALTKRRSPFNCTYLSPTISVNFCLNYSRSERGKEEFSFSFMKRFSFPLVSVFRLLSLSARKISFSAVMSSIPLSDERILAKKKNVEDGTSWAETVAHRLDWN